MKLIIALSLLLYAMVMCESDTVETVETVIEYFEEMEAETETETSTATNESVQSYNESESVESADATTNGTTIKPTLKPIEGPYKMGNLITCLEQNDEEPYGFKEKETYANLGSDQCAATPELCARYIDCEYDPEFCNEGDVCDHEDPLVYDENNNRLVRDSCKFAVTFLAETDEEKSWSWKCARHEICPIKDEEAHYYDRAGAIVPGVGMMGCLVNNKRVICCCQYDYCTKEEIYAQYAAFGRADHWPVNYQTLANIDPGDVYVVYDLPDDIVIPDWDCVHAGNCSLPTNAPTESVAIDDRNSSVDGNNQSYPSSSETSDIVSEEFGNDSNDSSSIMEMNVPETGETEGEAAGKSVGLHAMRYRYVASTGTGGQNEGVSIEDLLLICTLFIIGTLCMGIGVCIGMKWNNHRYVAMSKERYVDDI